VLKKTLKEITLLHPASNAGNPFNIGQHVVGTRITEKFKICSKTARFFSFGHKQISV
jgi:hypothetical protein